jgi:arginine decarboxylase
MLISLWDIQNYMTLKNLQECYNDALYYRENVREKFKRGLVSLRHRALADNIFFHLLGQIISHLKKLKQTPPELEGLEEVLYDIYYGNFSFSKACRIPGLSIRFFLSSPFTG